MERFTPKRTVHALTSDNVQAELVKGFWVIVRLYVAYELVKSWSGPADWLPEDVPFSAKSCTFTSLDVSLPSVFALRATA